MHKMPYYTSVFTEFVVYSIELNLFIWSVLMLILMKMGL